VGSLSFNSALKGVKFLSSNKENGIISRFLPISFNLEPRFSPYPPRLHPWLRDISTGAEVAITWWLIRCVSNFKDSDRNVFIIGETMINEGSVSTTNPIWSAQLNTLGFTDTHIWMRLFLMHFTSFSLLSNVHGLAWILYDLPLTSKFVSPSRLIPSWVDAWLGCDFSWFISNSVSEFHDSIFE
jgi:hypothetical protein